MSGKESPLVRVGSKPGLEDITWPIGAPLLIILDYALNPLAAAVEGFVV